ncbi:MAG: GNAT family N-acetyltransferase [Bacteroidetes bacterium]|nr:GNAT family N-acetyltransferase [Bacteroidota bacterium]
MPAEFHRDRFTVSTDPSRLDREAIHAALQESYWAPNRPREVVDRSLENSITFGLYDGNRQIGMVRVVTDYATFAWICDVYVLEAYRGQGLGKWLMECVVSYPEMQKMRRWLLATRDAHELYRKYGFNELTAPERWMEMRPADSPDNQALPAV